jgi:hypothetical protein
MQKSTAAISWVEQHAMPWLTPQVFKQGPDEALAKVPLFGDGPKRVRFRHIIHIYDDASVSGDTSILPITFETVERARGFAEPDVPVTCVAVTFPEDAARAPAGFVRAPALSRSVNEVAQFAIPRPLPLLFDILRNGVSAPLPVGLTPAYPDEIEFVIMTNADIHLQPAFYRVIAELVGQGYDVITVNRRSIDADPQNHALAARYWAERGRDHPGFDCFVFPSKMMADMVSSDSCCGAGNVMRSLLFNLVAHARRFLMLTHAQMTFHLGDDQYWAAERFADYADFNIAQAQSVIAALAQDAKKGERLAAFIAAHESAVFRRMLPTAKATWRGLTRRLSAYARARYRDRS